MLRSGGVHSEHGVQLACLVVVIAMGVEKGAFVALLPQQFDGPQGHRAAR